MKQLAVVIYWLIQLTWGFLQTLGGFMVFLCNIREKHSMYKGSIVTRWKSKSSLSMGLFVFVSDDPAYYYRDLENRVGEEEVYFRMLVHEYGHTIQSLFLGPAYLLVIGIPSFLWSTCPYFMRLRERKQMSYFSLYCERNANYLGEKVTGRLSMGQEL